MSRDASNRLCAALPDAPAKALHVLSAAVAERFGLAAVGEPVVGMDVAFCDYTEGSAIVGLEWDNWFGFIVVAKTQASEPLVRTIAEFLEQARSC